MDLKEVMSRKSLTPDEKLLLALETSDAQGGVNPVLIALPLGISERSCNNIIKLLAQANFVKKMENGNVFITAHGKSLCTILMSKN